VTSAAASSSSPLSPSPMSLQTSQCQNSTLQHHRRDSVASATTSKIAVGDGLATVLHSSEVTQAATPSSSLLLSTVSKSKGKKRNHSALSNNPAPFVVPSNADSMQRPLSPSSSTSLNENEDNDDSSNHNGNNPQTSGGNNSSENTGRWTTEEHRLFLQGLEQHGKGWKKIASLIQSRTVVQIRTHAQKYFQKLAKARMAAVNGSVPTGVTSLAGAGIDEIAGSMMIGADGLCGAITTAGGAAAAATAAAMAASSSAGAHRSNNSSNLTSATANTNGGMAIPPGGVIVAGTNVGGGILNVGFGPGGMNGLNLNASKRRKALSALQRCALATTTKRRTIRSIVISAQRQQRADAQMTIDTTAATSSKKLKQPDSATSSFATFRLPLKVAPALEYFVLPHYRILPKAKRQSTSTTLPPSPDGDELINTVGYDIVDGPALQDAMYVVFTKA
jgi:SHAQKYF class myb-like DNA-binding protein